MSGLQAAKRLRRGDARCRGDSALISFAAVHKSGFGTTRTFRNVRICVANGGKAGIMRTSQDVTWLIPTNQASQARSAAADG
jgi:hypothetical protein